MHFLSCCHPYSQSVLANGKREMGQDSVAKTDHWQHAERWCVAETKRETSPARGAVARLRAQLCHGESGLAQWDNHCTVREGERERK